MHERRSPTGCASSGYRLTPQRQLILARGRGARPRHPRRGARAGPRARPARSTPRPSTAPSRCSRSSAWCGTRTSATAPRPTTRPREHEHFHLVCRNCQRVRSVDPDVARRPGRGPAARARLRGRPRPPRGLRALRGLLPTAEMTPMSLSPAARPPRRRRRRRHRRRRSRRTTARSTASSAASCAGEGFVDLSHRDVVRIERSRPADLAALLTTQHFDGPRARHLDRGAGPQPAGPRRARLRRRRRRRGLRRPHRARRRQRRWSSSSTGCAS